MSGYICIGSNVLIGSGSEISANIHISAEETIEKNSYIMSVQ